jgi:amidohydrolase
MMGKVDTDNLKTTVTDEIDRRASELRDIALKIHANPELAFNEFQASALLTEYLKQNGFTVKRGIYDLPTAFEAGYGKGQPSVAFLAEYDALPEIGHACGHNLIAGASVGAAIGAMKAIDKCGGSIFVIGTPAEEVYGGKALMANRGAFINLDAAMLVHPDNTDFVTAFALACQGLDVEFIGKPAHAAARPENGINALDAMIISFNAINSLRQHIRSSARIHGIITDGGQAVNVVPDHSAGTFLVRSRDDAYLNELKEKVLNCFVAGATATGAELKYKWDEARYATMRNNLSLARLFQQNMRKLGRNPLLAEKGDALGSTDMGNVSQLVPTIHPYVAVGRGTSIHTREFTAASASEYGIEGMMDAAKAMAMTAVDLLADGAIIDQVKAEFKKQGKL